MANRSIGLFCGRFQPPSIAHVATAVTILEEWQALVIAISKPSSDLDYDSAWQSYVTESNQRNSNSHSIFSPAEVARMWNAWTKSACLTERVECCIAERAFMRGFNRRFPPEIYDYVHPSPHESDSDGDKLRHELYPKLMGRPVFLVDPPFRLKNSKIRAEVRTGKRTWEASLPPGAIDVFFEINGPERMQEVDL